MQALMMIFVVLVLTPACVLAITNRVSVVDSIFNVLRIYASIVKGIYRMVVSSKGNLPVIRK